MFINNIFNKKGLRLPLTLACILFSVIVQAQQWTGHVSSEWNNSSNWSSWPLDGEDIVIDPANYTGTKSAPFIATNSVFSPAGILIQNGGTLLVEANLTATDRIELLGANTKMTMRSGMVHAAGSGSDGRFIVSDGASVDMRWGLLKASQRVIVELGGYFELSGGTVNAVELAIGDGNGSGGSYFFMTGGTVETDGLGFENEAGDFDPTLRMTGGSLVVNGDMSWLGEAPGAGTPRFIMEGGSATLNGNMLNDPMSTVNLFVQVSGNAVFTFNGTSINQELSADSILQSGTSTMVLAGNSNWKNNGVFLGLGGRLVVQGNTLLNGTGTYLFSSVEIDSSGALEQGQPAEIRVAGNWINKGSWIANLNKVVFNGTGPQDIGGTAKTEFYHLEINNYSEAGVTLGAPVDVHSHLQLKRGRVNSSVSGMLTLLDDATASNGFSKSYVDGPMTKIGDEAFSFPIGNKGVWRRLRISAPNSPQAAFTAQYFYSEPSNNTSFLPPIKTVTNVEYWTLNGTANVAVMAMLYWEDALGSGINDCDKATMVRWNGTHWEEVPATANGNCAGNGVGMVVSNNVLTDPGMLTFGFLGRVNIIRPIICAGDSFSVGQSSYTATGNYEDILTASDMSDSTVITQLTVLSSYGFNGTLTLCDGESLVLGSNEYFVPGTYSDTLTSSFGCDSIVTVILEFTDPLDVSVKRDNNSLYAENSGQAYQWIDCSTGLPLTGDTSQMFVATQNGNYAVIITGSNGCSDTSACFALTNVGVSDMATDEIRIFPNPGAGVFTVELPFSADLILIDMAGRAMLEMSVEEGRRQLNISHLPDGVYFLNILNGSLLTRLRLVKY